MIKYLYPVLFAFIGVIVLTAIYIFADPLKDLVTDKIVNNREVSENTGWTYIGRVDVADFNENDENVGIHQCELYVKTINNNCFYEIDDYVDNCRFHTVVRNTKGQRYNAMYRDGKSRLNVPHW